MKLKTSQVIMLFNAVSAVNAMFIESKNGQNVPKPVSECPPLPGKAIYAISRNLKSAQAVSESYQDTLTTLRERAKAARPEKLDDKEAAAAYETVLADLNKEVKALDDEEVDFTEHKFTLKLTDIEACRIAPWILRDLDPVLTVDEM